MTETTDQPTDWLRGGWMLTHTGNRFWPMSPSVEDFNIEDIAHALSMQCRYNGHVRRFYSVAEHSVLIAGTLPSELALWGLMHDAAEAYVGDMIRPLKVDMPTFCAVEDEILKLIAEKWGLPYDGTLIPAEVKHADNRILLTERAELLDLNGHRWHESIEQLEPLGVTVTGWPPPYAKRRFLAAFEELTR